jgi:hypothetical protein
MSLRDEDRDPAVVLREAVPALALTATRRLYAEQPALWELGENGRARTLEDFTHHLRRLATLSEDTFRSHVEYCHDLFEARGFPRAWLDDAWRILDGVLRDELPPAVHEPARRVLHAVIGG